MRLNPFAARSSNSRSVGCNIQFASLTSGSKKEKGPQVSPAALLGNRFCDELQSRRAGGGIDVPTPPSRANISAREIHLEVKDPCEGGDCQPAVASRRKTQ